MKKQSIDITLTPKNCEKAGYEYITDILYDEESHTEHTNEITSQLLTGKKLGSPLKTDDVSVSLKKMLYGLYEPLTPEKRFLREITIDTSLTPLNAQEKGYQWVADGIFFDLDAGAELNKEVIAYVKRGYQLGMLKETGTVVEKVGNYFGLYAPL